MSQGCLTGAGKDDIFQNNSLPHIRVDKKYVSYNISVVALRVQPSITCLLKFITSVIKHKFSLCQSVKNYSLPLLRDDSFIFFC